VWPIAGAAVLLSVHLSELGRASLNPTNCMAYHESGQLFFLACTGNLANGFLDAIERSTHEFAAEMNDKRRQQRQGTIWHAKTLGEARGGSDGNGRKMQSENGLASLYMYTRSLYLNKARQNDGVLLAYALPNMGQGVESGKTGDQWLVLKAAIQRHSAADSSPGPSSNKNAALVRGLQRRATCQQFAVPLAKLDENTLSLVSCEKQGLTMVARILPFEKKSAFEYDISRRR